MTSSISVSLHLSGPVFDFEECSTAIGLNPTETWRRKVESDTLPEAGWSIGFVKRPYDWVDAAVSAVLDQVEGHEERIATYAETHGLDISLSCNVTIYRDRPLYSLTPATMRRLAELEAEFLLDIFDYSP